MFLFLALEGYQFDILQHVDLKKYLVKNPIVVSSQRHFYDKFPIGLGLENWLITCSYVGHWSV